MAAQNSSAAVIPGGESSGRFAGVLAGGGPGVREAKTKPSSHRPELGASKRGRWDAAPSSRHCPRGHGTPRTQVPPAQPRGKSRGGQSGAGEAPAHLAIGMKPRTPCRIGVWGESEREGSVHRTCVETAGRGTTTTVHHGRWGPAVSPGPEGGRERWHPGAHGHGEAALGLRGQKAETTPASGPRGLRPGWASSTGTTWRWPSCGNHFSVVSLLLPAPGEQVPPHSVLQGQLCTH